MDRQQLEERKARRLRFMRGAYDRADGQTSVMFESGEVAAGQDIGEAEGLQITRYLAQEGLLRIAGGGAGPDSKLITLTQAGVNEVERAIESPDEPTEHFSSVNYAITIGTANNVAIAQGEGASIDHVQFGADQREAILGVLDRFAELLTELPEEEAAVARADVATVRAQLESPKPKPGIVTEGMRSVRSLAEGVAGNAAFVGLVEAIDQLPI